MAVGPRLQARLGLDRAGFSRGLRGASAEASTFGRQIQGIGARLSAALGIGLGVGGLVQFSRQVRQTVRGIAEIGDEAKRSGMGVRAFQEWKFVAEQNRIGVDALVDGFKELSLRADEFITTGGGSGADAFKRLGFSADELKTKLKNPSDLMLEIIGRLKQLAPAARIRIMDEIFGGAGGEQFVQLVEQGEEGLRKTITAAHETGAVLDAQLIQKAEHLDRQWAELTTRAGAFFRSVVVGAADSLGIISDLQSKLDALPLNSSVAANDAVNSLRSMGEQLIRLREGAVATEFQDLARSIQQARDELDYGTISLEEFDARMEDAKEESERLRQELEAADRAEFSGVIGRLSELWTAVSAVADEAARLRSELPVDWEMAGSDGSQIGWTPDPNAPSTRPNRQGVNSRGDWEDARKKKPGGGGGAREDDYQRAIAAIKERTAALSLESAALVAAAEGGQAFGDAVEYARVRAELLNAAVRAGKAVTPELTAEVEALARAYVTAGSDAEEAADRLEAMKEAAERGADAISDIFMSVLDGTKGAMDAIADLLAEMAKVQMKKGLLGLAQGGGFFGWIGGLLGGNARGTSNWRGGMTRVNELGGEVMNLPRGTQIIPHDISKRMADQSASAQQALDIHITAGFDESGNLYVKDVARREAASMGAQINQALPDRIQQIMARPRVR